LIKEYRSEDKSLLKSRRRRRRRRQKGRRKTMVEVIGKKNEVKVKGRARIKSTNCRSTKIEREWMRSAGAGLQHRQQLELAAARDTKEHETEAGLIIKTNYNYYSTIT
jgi:ribosomal protein L44E